MSHNSSIDTSNTHWTEVISSNNRLLDFKLKEVWRYRDLLMLLVRRDFVSVYKQTILGPIWFVIQPILTTVMFMFVFGSMAKISTEGIPGILFYLAGLTLWGYFSECLNRTATVFKDNASVFGKVYFPRLVMPLSIVVSNLIKLGIQFGIFIIILAYFLVFRTDIQLQPNIYILLTPVLILIIGGLGLGFGMIISALTTKYRDLIFLLTFGVQLLMYATPIIYPISSLSEKFQKILLLNPISSLIETFRFAYLGTGTFSWSYLIYSFLFMVILNFSGIVIFNKVEKNFMDTV